MKQRAPHPDQIQQMMSAYGLEHKQAKRLLRQGCDKMYPVQISGGFTTIKKLQAQGYKMSRDFIYSPKGRFLFADESLATMVKMMDNP